MLELMKRIKYRFQKEELLRMALTHSSYANESREPCQSYERLEFLGDSILQLVASEAIFRRYDGLAEGEMSKLRASLVCEPALAEVARRYGLGDFVLLSRGERSSNGVRDSILCDVVESVIAAIYLDGGLAPAKAFILSWFEPALAAGKKRHPVFEDYKSRLQELLQERGTRAEYQPSGESGPDHDKTFFVRVSYDGRLLGEGKGRSKKAAEQDAARCALERLER